MALPVTDLFTDTTGTALTTYSASWTLNAGDFYIQSNALAPNSGGTVEGAARWNADAFPADQYSEAILEAQDATVDQRIGVGVRIATDSSANYYGLYYDWVQDATLLFKVVAGTLTQLGASFVGGKSAGDVQRLEIVGTTLTYKLNGVSQGTRSDSSLSTGSAGVVGKGTFATQQLRSWTGGSLAVALPPRIARIMAPQQRMG